MNRILQLLALVFLPALAFAQGGNLGSNSSPVERNIGQLLPGVSISVCQPLTTTAASVTSNLAVLTMSSNPVTAGFVAGMTIQVAGFTGGDTYLNGGTFTNGTGIASGFTILSVTSTTITYSLTHANASAATNGTVLQMGNATTGCGGLSSIFSDPATTQSLTQPLTTDPFGNWNAYASVANGGVYYAQFYGAGVTTTMRSYALACVPSSSSGTCGVYLNGNNAWTGNETHAGTEAFSNTITSTTTLTSNPFGLTWSPPNFTTTWPTVYNGANLTSPSWAASQQNQSMLINTGLFGLEIPSGSTIGTGTGISGYARTSSGTTGAVGVYGQGAMNANTSGIGAWGGNFLGTNCATQSCTAGNGFANSNVYGVEIDVNALTNAPTNARALLITGGSNVQATGLFYGIHINPAGVFACPVCIQWKDAIHLEDGASSGNGLYMGTQQQGNSQASQVMAQVGRDAGGVTHTTTLQTDLSGNANLTANGNLGFAELSNGDVQVRIGVNNNGGGFKHIRVASPLGGTCPTGAAIGNACTSANINWTNAFADNSYTITCTLDAVTNQPHIVNVTKLAAGAGFTITIATDLASAANAGADCVAVHD